MHPVAPPAAPADLADPAAPADLADPADPADPADLADPAPAAPAADRSTVWERGWHIPQSAASKRAQAKQTAKYLDLESRKEHPSLLGAQGKRKQNRQQEQFLRLPHELAQDTDAAWWDWGAPMGEAPRLGPGPDQLYPSHQPSHQPSHPLDLPDSTFSGTTELERFWAALSHADDDEARLLAALPVLMVLHHRKHAIPDEHASLMEEYRSVLKQSAFCRMAAEKLSDIHHEAWLFRRPPDEDCTPVALRLRAASVCSELLRDSRAAPGVSACRAGLLFREVLMTAQVRVDVLRKQASQMLQVAQRCVPGGTPAAQEKELRALHTAFWQGGLHQPNDLVQRFLMHEEAPMPKIHGREATVLHHWPPAPDAWFSGYVQCQDVVAQMHQGPDAPLWYIGADLAMHQAPCNKHAARMRAQAWAYALTSHLHLSHGDRWCGAATRVLDKIAEVLSLAELEVRCRPTREFRTATEWATKVREANQAAHEEIVHSFRRDLQRAFGPAAADHHGRCEAVPGCTWANIAPDATTVLARDFVLHCVCTHVPRQGDRETVWRTLQADACTMSASVLAAHAAMLTDDRTTFGKVLGDAFGGHWQRWVKVQLPRFYAQVLAPRALSMWRCLHTGRQAAHRAHESLDAQRLWTISQHLRPWTRQRNFETAQYALATAHACARSYTPLPLTEAACVSWWQAKLTRLYTSLMKRQQPSEFLRQVPAHAPQGAVSAQLAIVLLTCL